MMHLSVVSSLVTQSADANSFCKTELLTRLIRLSWLSDLLPRAHSGKLSPRDDPSCSSRS